MSELEGDQAGATADEAHDNDGTLDDEIDLTPAPTEPQILKKMMRSFLKMFSMDKGNLIMNMMTNSNWGGPISSKICPRPTLILLTRFLPLWIRR